MMKILLAILLSCFLTTSIVSCSFLKSDSDETAQEVTESGEDGDEEGEFGEDSDEDYDPLTEEDSDVATLDGEDEDDFGGDDDLDEDIGDDQDVDNVAEASEEASGDVAAADTSDDIEEVSDDELLDDDLDDGETVASNDENPADEIGFEDDFEEEPTTVAEAAAPPSLEPEPENNIVDVPEDNDIAAAPVEDFSSQEPTDGGVDLGYSDPEPKTYVSVKKAKTEPFNKNGVLANAIYLARSGDNLNSISQKIYGDTSKKKDLLKVNSTLARGVKVGDKIYYNSPQRPNDSSVLRTYYEDLNLSPEIYMTKPGDNIRAVSRNLLGHAGSWKEVWATNQNVESKGEVPAGLELRYWSDGGPAVATNVASNYNPPEPQAQPEEFNEPPPPEQEAFDPPPAPPEPIAQNIPPPPQAFEDNEALPPAPEPINEAVPPPPIANTEPTAPPPPPRVNAPPAPPAPQKMANNLSNRAKKIASTADKDQKMMMGALAIILIASILLFIIIKKKKSRRAIDFNTSTTQIE